MCWSCNCLRPSDDHGDSRAITTLTLKGAADHAGTDVPTVVGSIARTLALYRGRSAGPMTKADFAGCQVIKSVPERRYTLGLAYPANRADVGKAQDGFRDFVGTDALEEAAWSFLRKGGKVGLQHQDGTEGAGVVVESYIWPGDPWPQPNGYVVQKGDWLLGVQWQPRAWEAIKAGELNGFSPQGKARRRQPSAEALASLRR